jgi:4,5-dihydroxyphthalate decarboxylase
MDDLALRAAFGDYDHVAALRTGSVVPRGIELSVDTLSPSDIFLRMCESLEFDVSEMSMGAHAFLCAAGESPLLGIPAFPSRAFRHAMVYANVDANVDSPEHLNGKCVAIPEWGMTAVVWIVGILADEYGFDFRSVDWVAERKSRVPIALPDGMRMRLMAPGEALSEQLESGAVDAALIHHVPTCFENDSPRVKRIFADYDAAEREYYQRTGLHPIMHCVVVRRDVQRRHPWVARSMFDALCDARRIAMERLRDTGAYSVMLPFLPAVVDETRDIFGDDFWPYGVESNRAVLEKFAEYACRQGLTSRPLGTEELFPAELLV